MNKDGTVKEIRDSSSITGMDCQIIAPLRGAIFVIEGARSDPLGSLYG